MVLLVTVPEALEVNDHIEYKVVITINGVVRSVEWRRFRVMDAVFRKIKSAYPDTPDPPRKRYNVLKLRPSDIELRRVLLQDHLGLLAQHKAAWQDEDLRELLGYYCATAGHVMTVSADVMCRRNRRYLLRRYYAVLREFRAGTSLSDSMKSRTPRRTRTTLTQTRHSVALLLPPSGGVNLDATTTSLPLSPTGDGSEADRCVGSGSESDRGSGMCDQVTLDELALMVQRYQRKSEDSEKRAVAAELYAATVKHNPHRSISPACVFLDADDPPPDCTLQQAARPSSPSAGDAVVSPGGVAAAGGGAVVSFPESAPSAAGGVGLVQQRARVMSKKEDPTYLRNIKLAQIKDFETRRDITYYRVVVLTDNDRDYSVPRRYTSFNALRSTLQELGVVIPGFPTKFPRIMTSSLEARRASLDTWLKAVVAATMRDPVTGPHVLEFLTPNGQLLRESLDFETMHLRLCPFAVHNDEEDGAEEPPTPLGNGDIRASDETLLEGAPEHDTSRPVDTSAGAGGPRHAIGSPLACESPFEGHSYLSAALSDDADSFVHGA